MALHDDSPSQHERLLEQVSEFPGRYFVYLVELMVDEYRDHFRMYYPTKWRNPYKIGYSKDIAGRIKQLETGSPFNIELKAVIICSNQLDAAHVEILLHNLGKELGHHWNREWFNCGIIKEFNRLQQARKRSKRGYRQR